MLLLEDIVCALQDAELTVLDDYQYQEQNKPLPALAEDARAGFRDREAHAEAE